MDHLKIYQFDKKIRYGAKCDGGYVVGVLNGYDCYISAGISNEESFSSDFLNNNSIEFSYGFDGTIEDYPYEYTRKVKFIKKNINSFNDDFNTDLSDLLSKFNNIFLKMDIEGGEYPWILSLKQDQLTSIKQIVIEFHDLWDNRLGYTPEQKKECIERLNSHFYLVHAHGNVYGGTTNGVPNVIELTFINKKCFTEQPGLNKSRLPIKDLDYSNCPYREDIPLNF